MRRKYLLIVLMLFILTGLVFPGVAMADFDPQRGATDTLGFVKIVLIIVMIISALNAFLRHQLAITVGIVLAACVIYVVATPGIPESIGKGLLKLVGGE